MEKKAYFTIEEMVALPVIGKLALNDTGDMLAYTVKETDWKKNKYTNHVSIYRADQKKHIKISEEIDSSSPCWSPDSKTLAFLSNGKDKNQIFIKKENCAPQKITNINGNIEAFKWSPDGKGFFFLWNKEREELKKRKEIYGDFEYIDREIINNRLSYIDIEAALQLAEKTKQLPPDLINNEKKKDFVKEYTNGNKFNIYKFIVAPDNKRIYMITHPDSNLENTAYTTIRSLDVESGNIDVIDTTYESRNLEISPDGSSIVYDQEKKDLLWVGNNQYTILDLDTSEKKILDLGVDEILDIVTWTDEGIYFIWMSRTKSKLGCFNEKKGMELLLEESTFFQATISGLNEKIAVLKANEEETFEIYYDGTKITDMNKPYRERLTSIKRRISWNSLDGIEIEGILSLPVDYDEGKKYPLLLVVHGGPTWASFDIPTISKYYPIEQFVEKGFVVLEPNYRGSAAYGEEFRKLNYRNLGTGDYADIISGIDYLTEKEVVDPDKVGVMGWSQGGYISAFCATYSDRFKAISVGAGISDWVTYYYMTDVHQFTRYFLGSCPWDDEDIYKFTSPMNYIKNACTPTLIQHGDNDNRVPVANAFKLYQGLKDNEVPVELVVFKGMAHGTDKPGISRAIMTQNFIWFCHYLLGEPLEKFYLK